MLDTQIAKMLLDGDSYTTIQDVLNVSNDKILRVNEKIRVDIGAKIAKRIPDDQMEEIKQQAYRYFARNLKPQEVAVLLQIDTRLSYYLYSDWKYN